jgi:hypothetical protein
VAASHRGSVALGRQTIVVDCFGLTALLRVLLYFFDLLLSIFSLNVIRHYY